MIIGRVQGMSDVAMYSRANGLVELINRLLIRSALQICMPFFAKADRDQGSVIHAYLKSVSYLTAIGWPLLAFVGVAAFAAVRIVYGSQWDAAIPLAQILCAAFAVELLSVLSREALLACGYAKQANALQWRQQTMVVVGLLAVIPYGLVGAAWGVFAASVFGILLAQSYLGHAIGLKVGDFVRACAPSALLCVVSVAPAALWAAVQGVGEHNFVAFGFGGAAATVATWLVTVAWTGHPLAGEIADLGRRLRNTVGSGT
jgi:O-antigen/teichoic acid export membrane protein